MAKKWLANWLFECKLLLNLVIGLPSLRHGSCSSNLSDYTFDYNLYYNQRHLLDLFTVVSWRQASPLLLHLLDA